MELVYGSGVRVYSRSAGMFPTLHSPTNATTKPHQAVIQQLLTSLQNHPQAWAFLQPVNGEEVTDYYDVVKRPMGKDVLIRWLRMVDKLQFRFQYNGAQNDTRAV